VSGNYKMIAIEVWSSSTFFILVCPICFCFWFYFLDWYGHVIMFNLKITDSTIRIATIQIDIHVSYSFDIFCFRPRNP